MSNRQRGLYSKYIGQRVGGSGPYDPPPVGRIPEEAISRIGPWPNIAIVVAEDAPKLQVKAGPAPPYRSKSDDAT
jgi:hypothetical protein